MTTENKMQLHNILSIMVKEKRINEEEKVRILNKAGLCRQGINRYVEAVNQNGTPDVYDFNNLDI
mgnify:CR=1 FL=1